jgi:hypothetical protein
MITIPVTKRDIIPLVYFIVSMFQQENGHRQGTSSKSDYLGGYIDRWINKIPENLLFNNLLLDGKGFEVVNDYFIYGPQSDKNAPDILGIKANGNILKFAEFNENTWIPIEGMPYIEVKTFKHNQKLVSVRETQLKDDSYYVFVESDFRPDYLISLFEEPFFNNSIADEIRMDESFIRVNEGGVITQAQPVQTIDNSLIGNIGLITVIKGSDFRNGTTRCIAGENIYYIKSVVQRQRITGSNMDVLFSEMFHYNPTTDAFEKDWNGKRLIPITCNNPQNIRIVKQNAKSLIISTTGHCSIYDNELEPNGIYCIELAEFERSSGWTEFVGLKNQYSNVLNRTDELVAGLVDLKERYLNT